MSFKIGVLENFTIFTGKHLCWSLFFIKSVQVCNFIEKRLQHRRFPLNITKFLRTAYLIDLIRWLLFQVQNSFLELIKLWQCIYFCEGVDIIFKPGKIFRQNRCYVAQGKFLTGHQANYFLKKIRTWRICVVLKAIWSYCTLIIIKLVSINIQQNISTSTQLPSL